MATKRKKPTRSPKSRNSNGSLLEIVALRSSAEYRDAERMRRAKGANGAEILAKSNESSPEYAAVRLLIGTWETIAMRYEASGFTENEFFRGLPIGYMWNALKDAIKIIRADIGADYAASFESLFDKYDGWRKKSDKKYDSGTDSGIHALFG